jgi:hypothetical protein
MMRQTARGAVLLTLVTALFFPVPGAAKKNKTKRKAGEVELSFVDLGVHPVHDTGSYSGEIVLDVPEGAVSALLRCGGFGDSALGAAWTVTDPAGTVVWDGDVRPDEGYRSEFIGNDAMLLLPQSPDAPLVPGTYSVNFWIGRDNLGEVSCDAVIRTHPVNEQPQLDMELVFVGVPGLDTKSAKKHKGFGKFLDRTEELMAASDVQLDITLKDFTGDVDRFSVVDIGDDDPLEFHALLAQATPDEPHRITVFLVQEIVNTTAGGATILGVSGGPPGAVGMPGTSHSGLVVTALDLDARPDDVARILTHELGHYLGLYHTTEKSASDHDVVDDTPPCERDEDGDGVVSSKECQGIGTDNIMWWTLRPGTPSFSEDQKWVLHRSPAAR